jgi:hypothetical protein
MASSNQSVSEKARSAIQAVIESGQAKWYLSGGVERIEFTATGFCAWYDAEAARIRGCSCDGDPIECDHESASGHYEEKARQLDSVIQQVHDAAFMGGQDGESVRRFIQQVLVAAEKSGVIGSGVSSDGD